MQEPPKTKESKETLKKIKKKAVELEKDNDGHIYFFYSGNGWFKCGGNSALYLFHLVAPKTEGKYNPKIKPDTDFTDPFKNGVISTKGLTRIRECMDYLSIKEENREEEFGKAIVAFSIKEIFTEKEIEQALTSEKIKAEKVAGVLELVNSDPEIYSHIRLLQKNIYETVKKFNKEDRDTLGEKMLNATIELVLRYRDWANGVTLEKDGIAIMRRALDEITGCLMVAMENGIMSIGDIEKCSFQLESLKAAMRKRLSFLSH